MRSLFFKFLKPLALCSEVFAPCRQFSSMTLTILLKPRLEVEFRERQSKKFLQLWPFDVRAAPIFIIAKFFLYVLGIFCCVFSLTFFFYVGQILALY